MRAARTFSTLLTLTALPAAVTGQARTEAGPVIRSAGAVYAVQPTFTTPHDQDYRVAFDVATPASTPDRLNPAINTVARFLNMHAQAGVPRDRLSGAIVAHGRAAFELLDDEAYRARYGVDNPNAELIRELIGAGQPVILCGQSAASRGIEAGELIPGVEIALSAMTAFMVLQEDGYRVNPW